MTTQIFKTVFAGMLAALALFMLPFFLLRIFFFFLIVGAIFKLLGGKRWGSRGMHPAFANMSEEEKMAFKEKYCTRGNYAPSQENQQTIQS